MTCDADRAADGDHLADRVIDEGRDAGLDFRRMSAASPHRSREPGSWRAHARRRDWRRWPGRASRRPRPAPRRLRAAAGTAGACARCRYMLARISWSRIAEAVEAQHQCPGFGRHVLRRGELGQDDVGRRQARAGLGHALPGRLAAQPRDQRAEGEEVDGVGVIVARQHVVDALRAARPRASRAPAGSCSRGTGRPRGRPCPAGRAASPRAQAHGSAPSMRREVAPHEIDDAHADGGADVGEERRRSRPSPPLRRRPETDRSLGGLLGLLADHGEERGRLGLLRQLDQPFAQPREPRLPCRARCGPR